MTYNLAAERCSRCPAGKYQNEEGQKACKSCEKGHYSGQDGAENCTPCEKGETDLEITKNFNFCFLFKSKSSNICLCTCSNQCHMIYLMIEHVIQTMVCI